MWIPDPELVWKGAVLLEDYVGQKEIKVLFDEGEVSTACDKFGPL